MGLFLGILIKRSAFAVGAMVVWITIEQLIYGVLVWKFTSKETAQTIKNLLPLEAMQNLIIEPGTRLKAVKTISTQIGQEITKDYSVNFLNISIVLIWTFFFMYLSYGLLKKRDL